MNALTCIIRKVVTSKKKDEEMNCYREDCQHKTHHCCQECGVPVCKEHRKTICALTTFSEPSPTLGPLPVTIPNVEIVCDQCAEKLKERGQDFSEVSGL